MTPSWPYIIKSSVLLSAFFTLLYIFSEKADLLYLEQGVSTCHTDPIGLHPPFPF